MIVTGIISAHDAYVHRVEIYVQRISLARVCYFEGCPREKLDWGRGEGKEHMYLKRNIIGFRALNIVIPTQKFKRYIKIYNSTQNV